MHIAIITGASEGLGLAFVRSVVHERCAFGAVPFDEIWIISRSTVRLGAVQSGLDPARIRVIPMDITDPISIDRFEKRLLTQNPTIGLLINCAGMGQTGRFEDQDRNELSKTIHLNITALTQLTSICLPFMIPTGHLCTFRTGPRIIQVASSAGFVPQPGFAVYAATKAYVISFSRALHAELKFHNIASTAVCCGPLETGFVARASGGKQKKPGGIKSLFIAKPYKLSRKTILRSKRGRAVYVHGLSQKLFHVFAKLCFHRLVIFFIKISSRDAKPINYLPADPRVAPMPTVVSEKTSAAKKSDVSAKAKRKKHAAHVNPHANGYQDPKGLLPEHLPFTSDAGRNILENL